jgi:carboxymethylenebutenolidase
LSPERDRSINALPDTGEAITLHTAAGEELYAELFRPAASELPAPGIVIAPEMYGINGYIREVARSWTARGFFALPFDALWRVRRNLVLSYEGPDNKAAHDYHDEFDFPRAMPDVQAAIDTLRALPGANGKVGIVGFCLGGTIAYLAAARTDVDAAVGYYGSRIVEFLADARTIRNPLLLHFGELDKAIPPANRELVTAALAANPATVSSVHAQAKHAFANHLRPDRYDPPATQAADDATFALFRRELGR